MAYISFDFCPRSHDAVFFNAHAGTGCKFCKQHAIANAVGYNPRSTFAIVRSRIHSSARPGILRTHSDVRLVSMEDSGTWARNVQGMSYDGVVFRGDRITDGGDEFDFETGTNNTNHTDMNNQTDDDNDNPPQPERLGPQAATPTSPRYDSSQLSCHSPDG
ncbi:unnamed protein product [Prorocentrum cordatum]|uniref:Uncharacterized protein n=1 Tax=Prorocentrum cordatum TaxID=2364126 RepID=A0ABN9W6L6_9DINO|nr:unnamed protein product [Polarella glacialis]